MSIAIHILSDELENLNRQLKHAIHDLEQLPKGSIVKKRIRGIEYLYLQFKESGKVKSKFIKKDDDLEALKGLLESRDRLKVKVKSIKYEISEIGKVQKVLK